MMAVSYRVIVITYSRRGRERNIGMLEASIGLGYLSGPLLGSTLYNIGGFKTPYLVTSSVIAFFYPFIAY